MSISVNSEYIFNNRFSSSDKLSIDKSSCFPVSKKYGDIPKNSQIGIIYLAGGSVFLFFQFVIVLVFILIALHKSTCFNFFSSNMDNRFIIIDKIYTSFLLNKPNIHI